MSDLQELVERQDLDPEMMPSIISVDARVSIAMRTKAIITAVSRVAALVPVKELIPGTSMMLIEGFTPADSVPYIRFSTSTAHSLFDSQFVITRSPDHCFLEFSPH